MAVSEGEGLIPMKSKSRKKSILVKKNKELGRFEREGSQGWKVGDNGEGEQWAEKGLLAKQ